MNENRNKIIVKTSFLILLLLMPVYAQSIGSNIYKLSIADAAHHLADVSVEFHDIKSQTFVVKLPVWRTGRYEILDLPANIRKFKAYDAKGRPLQWQKINKNSWQITSNGANSIEVHYQIYANRLRDRVSHIDSTHAFLDASGVFIYNEEQRQKSLEVRLQVPTAWHSVSGLKSLAKDTFWAANYDQLVDSPIESGLHSLRTFTVEEQQYQILVWGDGNYDMDVLQSDISKLHHQAKFIWKSFPFSNYVFMYHAGNMLRGATEHVNSTIIQTDHFGFYPRKKYHKLISVTSHEFVHTWNVKAYRPAGISPYDYDKENYSDLFWMAEGTSSYYDKLLAARAGIFTIEEFLDDLAEDILEYSHKPGRKVMSLAESSYNTWLANNKSRTHNATVSIYLKGSLVSWLLDQQIRELSNNNKNLDDLSYLLYKNFAQSAQGYSSADVRQLLRELTGHDFTEFWQDYVEGTKAIDFDRLLAYYGLKIEEDTAADEEEEHIAFGWELQEENGLLKIAVIDADGSAWHAGLAQDDLLVAINGFQVNDDNIDKVLENLQANNTYSLSYFNQGQLKTTKIQAVQAPPAKLNIVAVDKISRKQQNHFESWLKHRFSK
ncbi:MAG TPA: M61 family peptidase [Oceanospirillales bacterium]|nr:M61 family peptidase [Oceanospirillales bacterium]